MKDDLQIRKANLQDNITNLILLAAKCVFEEYQVDNIEECCDYLFQKSKNKFSYENCYIVEKSNEIIGIYILYKANAEKDLSLNQEQLLLDKYNKKIKVVDNEGINNTYYLDTFVINPLYQGKGYGKIILNKIILEYQKISLLVDEDNVKAYNLYKNLGFEEYKKLTVFDGNYIQMII